MTFIDATADQLAQMLRDAAQNDIEPLLSQLKSVNQALGVRIPMDETTIRREMEEFDWTLDILLSGRRDSFHPDHIARAKELAEILAGRLTNFAHCEWNYSDSGAPTYLLRRMRRWNPDCDDLGEAVWMRDFAQHFYNDNNIVHLWHQNLAAQVVAAHLGWSGPAAHWRTSIRESLDRLADALEKAHAAARGER